VISIRGPPVRRPHRPARCCANARAGPAFDRLPAARCLSQSEFVEGDIVLNHCVQPDRYAGRICQIKLPKHDLVAPDLSQKILEDENCQSFSWTSSVSKAERGKAGIVANRVASSVCNDKQGAEAAICNMRLSSVLDLEIGDVKRTPCQADLPTFVIIDLCAGRDTEIALRIEPVWIRPVDRIQAGAGMRRADIAVPFER
jgi:hypothetical protein